MSARIWRVAVPVALLLAACGGSDGDSAEQPDTTTQATSPAEATNPPDTTEAPTTTAPAPDGPELTEAGDTTVDGTAGSVGDLVPAGAVVATATGSATLVWGDGSITRLAPGTEFTVGDGDPSRGELLAGRAWHRVAEQAAGSTYQVALGGATVTAMGTAFVTDCSTSCSVTTLEGVVEVALDGGDSTPLEPGVAIVVEAGAFGEPTPVNWDMAFGDPWVLESANADAAAGYPTGIELAEALGPRFASLDGTLLASNTVITNTNPDTGELAEGAVFQREYTFQLDCSTGYPCTGQGVTTYGGDAASGENTEVVTVALDGTTATWEVEYTTTTSCDNTATRVTHLVWTLTPTAAEVIDGRYVVVDGTGTVDGEYTVTDFGTCEFDPAWAFTEMHSEMDITGRL